MSDPRWTALGGPLAALAALVALAGRAPAEGCPPGRREMLLNVMGVGLRGEPAGGT